MFVPLKVDYNYTVFVDERDREDGKKSDHHVKFNGIGLKCIFLGVLIVFCVAVYSIKRGATGKKQNKCKKKQRRWRQFFSSNHMC